MRLLSLFLLFPFAAIAQPNHPLRLGKVPEMAVIPDSFANQSAVMVKERRQIEYVSEGNEIVTYRTIHRRVKLLDDKGVAAFNTVTIPIAPGREIVSIEARTLLPGGKAVDVKKEDVKRTKSEEGADQFLFALKGVERGAEVEYLYTEQRGLNFFGEETFQFGIPIMEAWFRLIAPEKMMFETKGYNGFPKAVDSMMDEVRYQTARMTGIPAVEEEPYSNPSSSLARVGYRLSYIKNGQENSKRLFTWDDLARQLHAQFYEPSDKERSAVRKYLKSLDVREEDEDARKIRTIENDLKKEIAMSEEIADDDETRNIVNILKKKVATESGFARLMIVALTEAGIPVQIGRTTNRSERLFDDLFANWLTIDQYVAYLPRQKAFMSPTAINYRYPFVPYVFTGQKGVFCKPGAKAEDAVAVVREITTVPADSSSHTTTARITFVGEDLEPRIELTNSFKGYNASGYREVFQFSPKDKEKELLKDITGLAAKVEDIDSFRVEGSAFTGYSTGKPLVLFTALKAPALMERAGPKYLFKVGDVIGKQVEMYNDEKRTLPIDVEYGHALIRELRIVPPAGYKISNPEVVKMKVMPMGEGPDAPLGFVSDYTTEGGELVIRIREFYHRTRFSISDYAQFRKVINAAADWNKVVLVLQKS